MISKGNHVKFARFVLLRFTSLTEEDIKKIVKTRTHKHKKVDEGGKGAVC